MKAKWFLQMVCFMSVPVFGYISFEFCQISNWIVTYLASGLSFTGVFLGWYLFD